MRVAGVLCALAAATALTVPAGPATSSDGGRVGGVVWADASPTVGAGSLAALHVALGPGAETEVTLRVAGGTVAGVPDACAPSTVIRRRSYLSGDGTQLVCVVVADRAEDLLVDLRVGAGPDPLSVLLAEAGAASSPPVRPVLTGPPDTPRRLRLISSPDFLNADIADLRRGPGFWNAHRSANSTSPA
jgi:hypothetical protein